MPAATPPDEAEIRAALSAPRSGTYIAACNGDTGAAVELYGWNARVSAALMLPAHFAEVSTRNATADVLERLYGPRWPWNPTFEASLPNAGRYNPRRDLLNTRGTNPTTGKVIAELKFVFWQKLFTSRNDVRLWEPHIAWAFPCAPTIAAASLRDRIYRDLDVLRHLRNRLAHREPVFARNLLDDLTRTLDLIELRSRSTSQWVRAMEDVTAIIAERP
jgi:Abi-like protein.